MDTVAPTLEETRLIYDDALAFKAQALWQWMLEGGIFGVRDPERGEIGYASVMGNRGEYLAPGDYLGSEGLEREMGRQSAAGDESRP